MIGKKAATPIILVVDDEALIRWSLSEGLADLGFQVRMAGSGAETRAALMAYRRHPLVVLLDLRLPDVSDLSLLHDIRILRPDAPVIVMSAHGMSEDANRALACGAFRFVHKPFDVPEMVKLVGEACATTAPPG